MELNKNAEISERITKIIDFQSDTKNSFAQKLGYPRSQTIYDVVNGKSAPSFDFFNRFVNSEYSAIFNIEWLLTGKGNMLKIDSSEKQALQEFILKTDTREHIQQIPLYNLEAAAGLVQLFNNKQHVEEYISIPNLPKCDGAVYITGDSMYPLLKSGDIVMYKQVNDIINGIFWGEMYLLTFEIAGDTYTMVKWLQRSEQGTDYIKLVSENQHHQSKDIPLKSIKAMAYIKASIRINSMT